MRLLANRWRNGVTGKGKRARETERREKRLTSLRGDKLVYAKTEKCHEEEGEKTREKERVVAYTGCPIITVALFLYESLDMKTTTNRVVTIKELTRHFYTQSVSYH